VHRECDHQDCPANEALVAVEKIRYCIIVCAVYVLGGLSSGFAQNKMELQQL